MKEKLLFLSPHLPAPNASEAGQVGIFRDLEVLSKKYEIHLVAFRNSVSQHWSVEAAERLCASTKIFSVTNLSRALSVLSNPGLPPIAAARASRRCAAYIRQLVKRHHFDRVHLEGQQMAVYSNIYGHIPQRTLYAHDVITQTFKRKTDRYSFPRNFLYAAEMSRVRRWECQVFGALTGIYVPSEKDVELIRAMNSAFASKTQYVQPFFRKYAARDSLPAGRQTLVYWGAYSREENVDAVKFLVDGVLPRLQAAGQDVKLIVAGANPPQAFEAFDRTNIEVTGFIDDPGDTLRSATIAVLPLRMGAGVKIKVLELLSAGVPVVTTPVGGEGIPCDGANGLIVTSMAAEDLAKTAIGILSLPSGQLLALSKAAAEWSRRYAEAGNSAILQ